MRRTISRADCASLAARAGTGISWAPSVKQSHLRPFLQELKSRPTAKSTGTDYNHRSSNRPCNHWWADCVSRRRDSRAFQKTATRTIDFHDYTLEKQQPFKRSVVTGISLRIDLTTIRRKSVSPISAFPQAMSLVKGRHGLFFIGALGVRPRAPAPLRSS